MNRREMIIATGGIAAVAATSGIVAAAEGQSKHDHAAASPGAKAMADSAFDCVRTAQAGIKHCLVELGKGDKSLALCATKMDELMSVTMAMGSLVSFGSPYAKDLAPLVIKVCDETDKECRKFPEHKECIECGDACKKCVEECKKMLAA
jgi:Cys-rich four helix bundle protein (predicted Tat secretion target)